MRGENKHWMQSLLKEDQLHSEKSMNSRIEIVTVFCSAHLDTADVSYGVGDDAFYLEKWSASALCNRTPRDEENVLCLPVQYSNC